jgi:hypothetical protein
MQAKSKQKDILKAAAKVGELNQLYWFAESHKAGVTAVVALGDGTSTLPVVPVIVSDVSITVDGKTVVCNPNSVEQAELSRLIAETMCRDMKQKADLKREVQPALCDAGEMKRLGATWTEWFVADAICASCGAINQDSFFVRVECETTVRYCRACMEEWV